MRVLVTGAAGFIGHHVSIRLSEAGHDVYALDNLMRPSKGTLKSLEDEGIPLIILDIRSSLLPEVLSRIKPDAIVHSAALVDVEESWRRPLLYDSINARGTLLLSRAAIKSGSRRLIYFSSAAVYGDPLELPLNEDHPARPISPYGASKLSGEVYLMAMERIGLRPASLRLFNVYGKGQCAGVVSRFLEQASHGGPLTVFGDGRQTRDFVFVEDVADAVLAALGSEDVCICNVGSGREVSVLELAESVMRVLGRRLEIEHGPARPGDIRRSVADIGRSWEVLGWRPRMDLEEGLARMGSGLHRHV